MHRVEMCPLCNFKPCAMECAWYDAAENECAVFLLATCVHGEALGVRVADCGDHVPVPVLGYATDAMDGGDAR